MRSLTLNLLQKRAVIAINKYLPQSTRQLDELIDETEPDALVSNLDVNNSDVSNLDVSNSDADAQNSDAQLLALINGDFHLEEQLKYSHLPKEPSNKHNFLLLGPAGSGKTTVITNAINTDKLNVAFCAFTNKATQVLKTISEKFNVTFTADFMTIHKLLMLEIKYLGTESEIAFDFDKTSVTHLKNYDVIIFDECSTISMELFSYIQQAWEFIFFKYNHRIKFIFLGDYWQLSPVGEYVSSVFSHANVEKWPVCKLSAVMRSGNTEIQAINHRLLKWVDVFRKKIKKPLKLFVNKYPYNLVMKRDHPNMYIKDSYGFYKQYMNTWKVDPDTVMLTYSKTNCRKTNFAIQDLVDTKAKRELPLERKDPQFYVGDRCCIDKPIEVCEIKHVDNKYVVLGDRVGAALYNGEIFDVTAVENVSVRTTLNKLSYITDYFAGQILTVKRISDATNTTYNIIHIAESIVNEARKKIKRRSRRQLFLNIFSAYIKFYPKLTYGYCITVYKSQGSEWRNVLVNLNSIKWSVVGSGTQVDPKKKRALFRTTYTSMSRASHSLKLFWF